MIKPIQIVALVAFSAAAINAADPEFAKDVVPVLNKYCVGCHAADSAEADLALDTFAALIKGGENGSTIDSKNLDASLLLKRLDDPDMPMPPEDEPRPTAEELAILKAWIKSGAKAPTKDIDPKIVQFDRLAASDAPSPVTAFAFPHSGSKNADLLLVGQGLMAGFEVKSKGGFLVPPKGGTQANAKPFTFFLANSKNLITAAAIPGTTIKIEGPIPIRIKYLGDDPKNDLTVTYSDDTFRSQPLDYTLAARGFAIARYGAVDVYDSPTELTHQLTTPGKVNSIRFADNGKQIIAASGVAGVEGEAILWSTDSGEVLQRFNAHDDAMHAAVISRDGKLVATGSYDRKIIIWDAKTGEQLRTLTGHNGAVFDLAFSPDAKVLVSASSDATVKVWNVATGERLDTLGQPLKEQYSVAISPDGKRIIAGGEDNRIRMWELVSVDKPQINPIVHSRFAHEGAVEQVRYSPDGKHIVSSASDNTIKVWSADLELLNAYEVPADTTESLAVSSSGTIAIGTVDGGVKKLQVKIGKQKNDQVVKSTKPKSQEKRTLAKMAEAEESEPNNKTPTAQTLVAPFKVNGIINGDSAKSDEDVFQFSAKAGEKWIVEVNAARDKSKLDSHVAILHADGSPVQRVQLRAIRDTYFTFRGKDSNGTGDFRLHNWEEMQLNQYLYAAGEVIRLYHYPRGPDSGFNVYPNFGSRRGYFDTTPMAHALHEPAYVVEPHPPGIELPPNGLPVFALNYENDDDSQRRLGDDSRLTFVAPKDGDYFVVLRDVRGMQGDDFTYELSVREPKPDFKCKVLSSDPKIVPGAGRKFGIEAERIDGFNGPIDIEISQLPEGFSVPGPLQIEAGHDRVWATLVAASGASTPDEKALKLIEIAATARIENTPVRRDAGSLGIIEVLESAELLVELVPDAEPTQGKAEYPVVELKAGETTTATIKVTRKGYDGRVELGNENGAVNAPHGVYVDNIGLNGVMIVEGQTERQFFITAEPWVQPMERVIYVEAANANKPTSNPVLLRILPADKPGGDDQVSR